MEGADQVPLRGEGFRGRDRDVPISYVTVRGGLPRWNAKIAPQEYSFAALTAPRQSLAFLPRDDNPGRYPHLVIARSDSDAAISYVAVRGGLPFPTAGDAGSLRAGKWRLYGYGRPRGKPGMTLILGGQGCGDIRALSRTASQQQVIPGEAETRDLDPVQAPPPCGHPSFPANAGRRGF